MFFCTNSNIWIVDAAPPPIPTRPSSVSTGWLYCIMVAGLLNHSSIPKTESVKRATSYPHSSYIPSHPVRPHFPFQAIHQRVSSEWVAHVWRNTKIWYENVAIIIYHHFASHRVASHRIAASHSQHISVQIPTHRIHHKHILSLQAVRASIAWPGADTLLQIRIQLADVRCTYIR